jgi:class 3 adenylate cyclase
MAGFVFEFIQRVDQLARVADGTVVKRIGDELMVTLRTYRRQSVLSAR